MSNNTAPACSNNNHAPCTLTLFSCLRKGVDYVFGLFHDCSAADHELLRDLSRAVFSFSLLYAQYCI